MLLALALLACTGGSPTDDTDVLAETPAPAGPLQVGVARVRMPVPVGIGTVGYGGFDVSSEPSPFAEIYPATNRIHAHPDFRAVVLSRGPGHEVVFLRSDTVGVFQQLRRAVVLELQTRLGRDLDDALVIGATHTHAGPGRVIDAEGPFELIADRFFPEHYDRMVAAMADAVEAAYADLAPGRVGVAWTDCSDAIDDRRCEDGTDHVNGALPILGVEQGGELAALVVTVPVHGTVLSIEDLTLSQDVSGGIEAAIEDRFSAPVQVLMLNAWAGDVSPGSPSVPLQDGASMPDGYARMAEIGQSVADVVADAVPGIAWESEPTLHVETHRMRIDREVLEYPDDTFRYDYGAVYCGLGLESDCDPATTVDDLDERCIWFSEDFSAPLQTEITAGTVGPLHLVTFPGEPTTAVAEALIGRLGTELGLSNVWFVGYGQDYLGYSLLEDDWWQGGYEASGTLWGPRQGEYLLDQAFRVSSLATGEGSAQRGLDPVQPFGGREYAPFLVTPPRGLGTIVSDVPATAGLADVVTFTVNGLDPWLGAPLAFLEHADGTPVVRPNGLPVDSDGASFWIDLVPDPPYADGLEQPERAFQWTFSVPVRSPVVGHGPTLNGDYRLRVHLPDGSEVVSGTFTAAP
ncbi:MAG: hypothetical protein ACI8PZ_002063 [Myxococcota bacterium]|jgi:hypothetical protein